MNARGDAGSALLLAIVAAAALTATSASALSAALAAAREIGAREEVLCARYAALGAVTARARGVHWRSAAADSTDVEIVAGPRGEPAARATVRCRRATRSALRAVAEP